MTRAPLCRSRLIALAFVAFAAAAACGPARGGPLLDDLRVSPAPPSPRDDVTANLRDVHYTLHAPAQVTAYVQATDGQRWPVHDDARRPLAGDYVLALDGTVPGPGPNERTALPDGQYQVILAASPDGQGQPDQAAVPFVVNDSDTQPPTIENFALVPDTLTPNSDAQDDVARMTFRVLKDARLQAFADRIQPDGSRLRIWAGEELQVTAGEQRAQWDGMVAGKPVADGQYEVGVRARDTSGNIREARQAMTVAQGGTPDAKVVWARIGPRQIIRGSQVCTDVTVRNTGNTVLRTQGPDPGYVYNSFDSYSSIENHAYPERAGLWRIGLDWAGSPDTTGARYPYRWGFGHDLAPGEEATVHGCVQVNNEQSKLVFFAALIQENVSLHDNGVGLVPVQVSP